MKVGHLLRQARTRVGFSQSLLARLSGVAQPKVSAYESGREFPTTRTLVRVLDACGAELALTSRRVPAEEMSRTERRSLELHRTIAAHLLADDQTRGRLLADATRALSESRETNPYGSLWHDQWTQLLDGPVDELVAVLIGENEHSVELRVNSPFVGAVDDEALEEATGASLRA